MQRSDALEELSVRDWSGPFAPEDQARALAGLESGRVIFLPALAFKVEADEQAFLDPSIAAADRKNISLDPGAATCDAALLPKENQRALRR